MQEPLVACIILNNNRREDTVACLESVYSNTYKNFIVLVLDNQSGDGTVELLRNKYTSAEVIELVTNEGYAGNNNFGIRAAIQRGADWFFILNEDTILDQECIARLVEAGESSAQVGIVGPMVYHFDDPQYIQSGGGIVGRYWENIHLNRNQLDCGQLPARHVVDWISGCAIMVRLEVIKQVGVLDEDFFCYWEEIEWCFRASKSGWQIIHEPTAKLWHKGVQRDYAPKPMVTYYSTRNRLLMALKHQAPARVWLNATVEIARTLISWSVRPKWREKRAHRDAMWLGFFDFLRKRWGKQENY